MNQKTFLNPGRRSLTSTGQCTKVFCFFFSKKKRLLANLRSRAVALYRRSAI
jgi:hypothetical protein